MAGCGSKRAASTDGGSKTESEAGSDAAAADSREKPCVSAWNVPMHRTAGHRAMIPTEPFRFPGSSDYAYGYDVMMAKHICEELGWDLEIVKDGLGQPSDISKFRSH